MSHVDVNMVNLEDVLLQAPLVPGAMRTVRTTLLRIFAALDLQVGLHVSQPAVAVAAFRTREAAGSLVEVRSVGKIRIHDPASSKDRFLTRILILILILIRPRYRSCKKIKCNG